MALILPATFCLNSMLWSASADAGAAGAIRDSNSTFLLTPGQPTRQELSTGQSHSYRIVLNSGQYLRVVIELRGIDVGGAIHGPSGAILTEFNCCHSGPTPVSLIAGASGTYLLEVRSLEKDWVSGSYEVRIEGLRPVKAQDNRRVVAEKAFTEAERLRALWKAEFRREAIKKYAEARLLWKTAGEKQEAAGALRNIGELYDQSGEPQQALKYYKQSLRLSRQMNDRRGEAESFNGISPVYLSLGENQKALQYCTRALKLSRAVGHRRGEARALHNIGEVYYYFGNFQKALDYYNQALQIWLSLSDRRGRAETLMLSSYSYAGLSNTRQALDCSKQALSLWRAAGDLRGQAYTLTGIGHFSSVLGEKQEALDLYNQAMPLLQDMSDQLGKARVLDGMGYVYDELGDKQRAIEYYTQALHLQQSLGRRDGEAGHLLRIGEIFYSLGDNRQALDHCRQALSIFSALSDKRMESYALRYTGAVYDSLGNKARALQYYNHALSLNRGGKDRRGEAYTLDSIGQVYLGLGQKQKALDCFNRALDLNRAAQDPGGETLTLYNIARVERDHGNLDKARSQIEAALKITESLRTKVASENLRATYFASVHQQYELYIDLLMRLHEERPAEGYDATALEASERSRARTLLETLKEARVGVGQEVDPALLERERALQQALDDKAQRQMRLLAGNHTQEGATDIAKEIDQLTNEYDEVKAQIRARSPRYAALTQPQPLTLKEIQQQIIDDNTLLLEYALGDERSYLWAVTRRGITSHVLPGRGEIEGAARHFYDLLVARQPVPGEAFEQRQARTTESDAQLSSQAAELSRILLAPVAPQLGKKRLLIVPDGALQYVPFQALTVPETGDQREQPARAMSTEDLVPLVLEHEIVSDPSASTLAALRSETASRKPAPKTVAVLADPVFESDDSRIQDRNRPQGATVEQPQIAEVHRIWRDANLGGRFPRLLSSRHEAEIIMASAPAGAGLEATDFEASRETAMRPDLGRYRIVHFATHGILNSEHPGLSGVVLSLMDRHGQPQNGFLRLHDIYNMNFPVELVVLSACNTGLGKDIKGEGLVGLTRGFMYAGAARVLASLWKVDDESTAELMKHFYRGVLKDGLPPVAALRQAQVRMWRQKEWRSPYYWAAFVIQGEYKGNIVAGERDASAGKVVGAGAAILFLSLSTLYAVKQRRKTLRKKPAAVQ